MKYDAVFSELVKMGCACIENVAALDLGIFLISDGS